MQFSKTLIISIFLLLTSKTFPAEEVCLQPLPAKQRGNGTGWLFENITDSRARVKLFGAYYFYSALEWLYRNDVKEEAVLDKTLSGRNTYYKGISKTTGALIEMFAEGGSIPTFVKVNGEVPKVDGRPVYHLLYVMGGCSYESLP